MASEKKFGCFKCGCLGCLGIGVLLFVFVLLILLIGAATTPDPRMESVDVSHDVFGRRPITAPGESPSIEAQPEPLPRLVPATDVPGRIILDIHRIRFDIEPGPPGSPIRLEGSYDAARLELVESYRTNGNSGWTYVLSVGRRGWGLSLIQNL